MWEVVEVGYVGGGLRAVLVGPWLFVGGGGTTSRRILSGAMGTIGR